MGLVMWSAAFVLSFGVLGLAAGGPSCERRSHFWLRLVLLPLVPVSALLLLAAYVPIETWPSLSAMLGMLAIPALMFVQALLYRNAVPPPGHDDHGDGGGPGPDAPPPPGEPPRGGIPLPDATPALARIRDHNRPRLGDRTARRPAREPARTPGPARETAQTPRRAPRPTSATRST